jgi:hypothetical protein
MRAFEFLIEDARQKSIVMRQLGKMDAEAPIFNDVYKQLINKPLGGRIENYIKARGDQDAIAAVKWLLKTIPTLGNSDEVKEFMEKFQDPNFDPINIKSLTTTMTSPAPLANIVTDNFVKKLFDQLHLDFKGKEDAGPGEAALAVLSPNITYSSPGDIRVGSNKVEVKAATKASGKSGRIWDHPVHIKPMLDIIEPLGITSFTVMQGTSEFPGEPEEKDAFIKAACEAWFGEERGDIISAFGTSSFKDVWQAAVFEKYKELSGWQGLLAIGLTSYQYIETGADFAKNMAKANQGTLCRKGNKQARDLAPQIMIK